MLEFCKENHNVFLLYRFHNPKWEEKFQKKSLDWRWYPCMIHFYARFAFAIIALVSYQPQRWAVLPPPFWGYVAIMALTLVCLLLGHFTHFCRRWILQFHFVFCLCVSGFYAYICLQYATSWTTASYTAWIPSPDYHLVVVGPKDSHIVDATFWPFLQRMCAIRAVLTVYLELLSPWTQSALTGLTPYTLAVHALSVIGILIAIVLTPGLILVDVICYCVLIVMSSSFYLFVATVVERWSRIQFLTEMFLARELQASQSADSILNHTLKNTLSDVAGTIELYLANMVQRNTLEGAMDRLRRGMRACKERQVFLKLVGGDYVPALHAVDLQEFGRELVAGRDVSVNFKKLTVYTDESLLNLVLDNAISNAFRHGDPDNPQVTFTIDSSPLHSPLLPDCRRLLHFTLTNVAHPHRPPLTPEFAAQLLAGKANVPPNSVLPALCDGVGIAHSVLAAQAGGITLQLSQQGELVTFCASVAVEVFPDEAPRTALSPLAAAGAKAFPAGLCFAVLDDSPTALRLLHFYITTWCSPSAVHCFGKREEDIEAFMTTALDEADIVILDQNLEYSQSHLGSDLARRLRRAGFAGFVCLRSANDSAEDRALYMRSGAHCCFGKDLLGRQLMVELKEAYHLFRRNAEVRAGSIDSCSSDNSTFREVSIPQDRLHVPMLPPVNLLASVPSTW